MADSTSSIPQGGIPVAATTRVDMAASYPPRARRVSWGAVFAGFVVAVATQYVLSLLGLSIGFTTIEPATEGVPSAGAFATGTIVWWCITALIALFLGGAVAGRLAGVPLRWDSAIHGVLSWCLMAVLSLLMLTSAAGQLLSTATAAIGYGVSGVSAGVSAIDMDANAVRGIGEATGLADPNTRSSIRAEFEQLLRDTGKPALEPNSLENAAGRVGTAARTAATRAATQPATTDEQSRGVFDSFMREVERVGDAADRDALVNVLVARTDMDRAEAERVVDRWSSQFRSLGRRAGEAWDETQRAAAETTEYAAETMSAAAFWTFVAMVLGAAASFFGGWVFTPHRIPTDEFASVSRTERLR